MRFKGLISKVIIIVVVIAATSLIAAVKFDSYQGRIVNPFRNVSESNFTANPNPFKDFTVITVKFDETVQGSLVIEDSNGRHVKELFNGFFHGTMDFTWDATDEKGKPVNLGTYYCNLNTGNSYTSRTIILILK